MDPSITLHIGINGYWEKIIFCKNMRIGSASCFIPRIKVRRIIVVKINFLGYFVP